LSKSPKDLLGAEFANLKIASPADCYRTSMAKSFPKTLRTLYRGGGTWASNRLTSDDVVIDVIERHDHETGNLRHKPAASRSHCNRACASTRAMGSNHNGKYEQALCCIVFRSIWRRAGADYLPINSFLLFSS
jgi:hypothetical protein